MPKVKRLVLGLTGGLGTGKSTVTEMMKAEGVPCLSADEVAHQAIRKGQPAYKKVVRHFGPTILLNDEEIDRSALGRLVFAQPVQRHRLEEMIHPEVFKATQSFIKARRGLVLLDIPLLFESRWQRYVDKVIVVSATRANQIKRLKLRNRWSPSQIQQRLAAQWPMGQKVKRADYVLKNDGTKATLRRQIKILLKVLNSA